MSSPNEDEAEDGDLAETSMGQLVKPSFLSRLSSRTSLIGPNKFNITVYLLDRNEKHFYEYKKSATGQDVLDDVCKLLNIVEKEYFGLQYEDNLFRYWVELSKPLSKQFHRKSVVLRLRVRFYPTDPSCIKEAITRYQLCVQIRRDLLRGRLICSQSKGAKLAALILQASIGDYNPDTMHEDGDYVSSYALIMKQSHKTEEQIAEAHKLYRGFTTEEAEKMFLEVASRLDTYGFDPYVVKNMGQTQEVTVGATSHGVLLFVRGQKMHTLNWSDIEKVDYIGKQLTITPSVEYIANYSNQKASSLDEAGEIDLHNTSFTSSLFDSSDHSGKSKSKKENLKLICPSTAYAKNLWRHILSQQVFFTEDRAIAVKPKFSKPRIPLFSRGSTFRCPTPRVFHELELDSSPPRPDSENSFERQPLRKCEPRSVEEAWNVNRTSSAHNSLERNAKLLTGGGVSRAVSGGDCASSEVNVDNDVASSPESASNPFRLSAGEASEMNAQSFLDNSDSATTKSHKSFNSTLPIISQHNAIPNGLPENGILNGSIHKGHVASDETDEIKEEIENITSDKFSLVMSLSVFVLIVAFLVTYFFYPDSLSQITLSLNRILHQLSSHLPLSS